MQREILGIRLDLFTKTQSGWKWRMSDAQRIIFWEYDMSHDGWVDSIDYK